jgi:uncharacterized protein RhaS with RHS repeats
MILPDGSNYSYNYYEDGSRKKLTVKIGQAVPWTIDYSYDKQNRLSSVSSETILETYNYQNNGLLGKVNGPNSISKTLTYDGQLLKKLEERKLSDNSIQSSFTYGYDEADNINKINLTESFSYDDLNRIISTSSSNEIRELYSYDLRGNREFLAGDPIIMDPAEYEYDAWNRLEKVNTGGNKTVQYKYNDE